MRRSIANDASSSSVGTLNPPRATITGQQRAFNTFRIEYNDERGHQSFKAPLRTRRAQLSHYGDARRVQLQFHVAPAKLLR